MSRTTRAAGAGIAGAIAYLVAQEVDRRVVERRANDLILLGGLVTERRAIWQPLGLALHLLAGASFGLIFDRLVASRLPGPYWLRGLLLAQIENVTLWPLVLLIDRSHVAVKSGELARLNRPSYFGQAVWRHAALGAVMGALLDPELITAS